MSRFLRVPAPVFSPTRCTSCSGNRCDNGFFDLMVDTEAVNGYREDGEPMPARPGEGVFGHLYLCADCLDQLITLRGGLTPESAAELDGQLVLQGTRIVRLEEELEQERAPEAKVVSIEELRKYLRRDVEPEPEPTLPAAA